MLGRVQKLKAMSIRSASGSFSLSLAARQSVGTMSKHAPGAEHHARRPGAPVLGMTVREDRDFAGDVQVMHVPADASLDERRGGCGERTGAVRHVPCRESACSDGLESMIRRVRTELKFTFA